jgi:predicted Fe-Mo cluster-binding NifX family protein
MMKTAFAYWENRIAPVFDTACQIHVVEAESGQIVCETQEMLSEDLPVQKTLRLVGLGIGTVVCGAISRPMYGLVTAYGIQVIPFVTGDLREVIQAWLGGNLAHKTFVMPGCRGRGAWRLNQSHEGNQEVYTMKRRGRGMGAGGGRGQGQGQGQGQRQGQGARRGGRVGGSATADSTGDCVCPQCGEKEPHKRGMPCAERKCPKCGTVMTRQ